MKTPAMEIAADASEIVVTIGKGGPTVTTLRLSPDEAALLACDFAAASRDARESATPLVWRREKAAGL